MSARRAALSSVTQISAAGLTTIAMILASRRGLFVDIASYSAGSALTALAAVLLGSGTTLNYLTGNDQQRRAVLRIRTAVVLPGLLVAAALSIVLALHSATLSVTGAFFGGLFVVFSNLSELPSAALQRNLRTQRILAATLVGRIVTLAMVLFGVLFSISAAAGMAVTFVGLASACWSELSFFDRPRLKPSIRLAFSGRTAGLALAEASYQKSLFLVAPYAFSSGAFAGQFSTLASGQQSVFSALIAPLYSGMANARAHGRGAWVRKIESMALLGALTSCVVGILAAKPVVLLLGMPAQQAGPWRMLMLAIPLGVFNRMVMYRKMGSGDLKSASRLLGTIATVTVLTCLWGLLKNPDVLPLAFTAAEAVGACLAVALLLRRDR